MLSLPFGLTWVFIWWMTFSCLLTIATLGSTFIFFWEKCVLTARRRREHDAWIAERENQMIMQLCVVVRQIAKLNISESHGLKHARIVLLHAMLALNKYSDRINISQITLNDRFAVLLAALLHDVDDRKYFPMHDNFENARIFMYIAHVDDDIQAAVIRMIGYVSASKNRDSIPDEWVNSPWVLIPRHCDRLEAVGWVGIVRAWEYTIETHGKLFTTGTLCATTRAELAKIVVPVRYKLYSATGKSRSMMDHFYDKLLHLHKEPMYNGYLDREKMRRLKPMITFCIIFGRTKKINRAILKFAREQAIIEARAIESKVKEIMPMSRMMREAIDKIMSM